MVPRKRTTALSLSRRQFLRFGAGAAAGVLWSGTGSLAHSGPDDEATIADGDLVIRNVNTSARKVCLTFDDLWTESYALQIGREFQRRGIGLTLFPVGRAVQNNLERPNPGYTDLYPRLREMGHEFGSHLFSHRVIKDMSLQQLIDEEMEPSLRALRRALGSSYRPIGIRPPYGQVTDALRELSERYGIPLILWGLDSQDAICTSQRCKDACVAEELSSDEVYMRIWRESSMDGMCTKQNCADGCVQTILKNYETYMRPGTIILHHGIKASFMAIPHIVAFLKDWNLQPIPLSQLLTFRSA